MLHMFHMNRSKLVFLMLLFNSFTLFAMEKKKEKDIIFSIGQPERYIIDDLVRKLKENKLNVRFSEKDEKFPSDALVIETYLGYGRADRLNRKAALQLFLGDSDNLNVARRLLRLKDAVYCEASFTPEERKWSLVDSDACFKELHTKITATLNTEKEIKAEKKAIVLQVSAEDAQKAQDLKKELAANGVEVQIAIRGESLPQNSILIPLASGLK